MRGDVLPAGRFRLRPFVCFDGMPFLLSCLIAGIAMKTPMAVQKGTVQPADADLSKAYGLAYAVALSFLAITILVIWLLLRGSPERIGISAHPSNFP